MKAIKDNKIYTIKEAVEYTLAPSAYSYDGELERIKETIRLQTEMICKLVDRLTNNGLLNGELGLEELLEYGFTVEND